MTAAMCQAVLSFYSEYCQKSLFISVSSDFYEKYIVTNNFCVSTHYFYCSLEKCKFHILLIGSSFDKILLRLGNFHFKIQIIDCLHTMYKNRFYLFYSNVTSSTGEVFHQLDRAVHHNFKAKGAENCQLLQRKDCYAKNSNVTIYVLTRN